ncbi:hypothetical protein [Trichocoleus sp. FACHB-262]|uniref:hypothetical protein n=1 Tax=Trichocoleus sp. FACHB-262 TaxID=2692869 RepID=UPI001687BFED|nr:hypothetical protein [Trichocoleus sp. FACHB-262]MBD2123683.1 hypothetical protein [Trichocoleus sp. FACHB-262]
MPFLPKAIASHRYWLLLYLATADVGFTLIYLVSSLLQNQALPLFSFEQKFTIPVVYAAIKLFLIGCFLVTSALWKYCLFQRSSRYLLLTMGAGFLYLSTDKLFKFHHLLQLPNWMPSLPGGGGAWILFYLFIQLLIVTVGFRDLTKLWRFYPQGALMICLGIALFIVGGLGTEIFNHLILQPLLWHMGRGDRATFSTLKNTVEESLELLGESIALQGLVLFLLKQQHHYFNLQAKKLS